MKWVIFSLFFAVCVARAQGPDQHYIQIYNLIGQADTLREAGQSGTASEYYREAQDALQRMQKAYPSWNEDVINFRLQYIASKLQQLDTAKPKSSPATSPSTAATLAPESVSGNPTAAPTGAINAEQVRQLQAEKAALEAKLREALSVQPAAVAPVELARTQEQLINAEKERDLLKVALEATQQKKPAEQTAPPSQETAERLKTLEQERDRLQREVEAALAASARAAVRNEKPQRDLELEKLRARLEVLEARPVPYTQEELALFRQTSPQLAPIPEKTAKKSKSLPAGAGPLVSQAERAFAGQRFEEAEKKYLEVLRQDENNVYILGNLAATQMELSKPKEVEESIQRALAIDPDDAFTLTLLGMLKFRQNKYDEALDVLSRAGKIDPQNPETQNYLGITLSQQGQRAPAEAALRKAIKIQPNYAGAHHNLAVVYATQRPPFVELAKWHYERARSLGHSANPDLEKLITGSK